MRGYALLVVDANEMELEAVALQRSSAVSKTPDDAAIVAVPDSGWRDRRLAEADPSRRRLNPGHRMNRSHTRAHHRGLEEESRWRKGELRLLRYGDHDINTYLAVTRVELLTRSMAAVAAKRKARRRRPSRSTPSTRSST